MFHLNIIVSPEMTAFVKPALFPTSATACSQVVKTAYFQDETILFSLIYFSGQIPLLTWIDFHGILFTKF